MTVKLLALDTCTEACSAAVMHDDAVFADFVVSPREHSQRLLPMAQDLLNQAKLQLADLDAIVFGRGPGSFTGVRIGTSAAQGLALGADKPLVPVSTLAAMACYANRYGWGNVVVTAIDARMDEVYFAVYQCADSGELVELVPELVLPPEAVAQKLADAGIESGVAVGTGWAAYGERFDLPAGIVVREEQVLPHAEDMLLLGKQALSRGEALDAAEAQPVYLRDTVTWKKLPGRE